PSMGVMSTVPSEEEYLALISLYNATNGGSWNNKSGWHSVPVYPVPSVANWYGIPSLTGNGNVRVLDLRLNGLDGFIPQAIRDLVHLEELRLGGNSLSGTIPASITNLTNLRYLDLENTDLGGPVPLNGFGF